MSAVQMSVMASSLARPAAGFSDNFNRADGAVGAGYTSTNSTVWIVKSNRCQMQNGAPTPGYLLRDQAGINTIQVSSISFAAELRLVFRYLDPNNFWTLVTADNIGRFRLEKNVGGANTVVDTAAAGSNVNDSSQNITETFRIEISTASGGTIVTKRNGVTIQNLTGQSDLANGGTKYGFGGNIATGGQENYNLFDDFTLS